MSTVNTTSKATHQNCITSSLLKTYSYLYKLVGAHCSSHIGTIHISIG